MDLELRLDEHAAFLRAIARRLVADGSAADDLVQETFVRALTSRRDGIRETRSWLAAIVRNVFRDQRAATAARQQREAECARARLGEQRPADPLGVDELTRALQALPVEYRHALHLRYYAQRSAAEIAAELGVPVATVKTRLHRGLELLRADLTQRAGGEGRLRLLLAPLVVPVAPAAAAAATSIVGAIVMKKILIAAAALSFAALALVLVAPWRSADPAPVAAARAATTRASGATGAGSVAAVEASRADAAPAAAEVRPAADRTRAASAGAAVRGRVVYEATGEGVPFLDLAVRDARGREDLVTDRDGEFATTRGFDADAEITAEGLRAPAGKDRVLFDGNFQRLPAGAVVLRPTDGSPPYLQWKDDGAGRTAAKVETWRRIDESGGAAAVRLAVALGPTYFVDGRLPAGCGVADVAVALGRRDDTDIMWLRQWSATAAPLREVPDRSGRYWCRPRATTRVGADDAALFVATADGLWRGTAPVRETIGVQDEPVVIAFTGAGVVTGVVTDSQGQACGGLWVTIVRTAESRVDQTSSRTDEQGRYRIANVIPGPARLEVAGERTEPWRQGIDVIAGREVRRDIVLAARRIGGAIAGTITTDSGARFPMCSVILTSHDDATLWRTARIEWQEVDGRQQASWSFADVPAIACDVTLETFEPCGVAAPHFRVVAPAEGVAFRVHDALPRQQAVVRVVDDGGRELGGWSLFLRGDAGWQMRLDQKEPGAHRVELPIGASFVWRVAGDGIRTRSGTATPAPDAPLELLVATTPGFSTLLTCMDIANFYAARGVEVFADDAPVGATDEQGDLWLDLAKRPNALRLDPAAWRIFHDSSHRSDVDAATGGFTHRDAGARLHLYVQRVY